MSHAEFAYRALWDTALTMSAAILAAGLMGGLLASLVLRRISRPLGRCWPRPMPSTSIASSPCRNPGYRN
jgi:hypothetical protein